MKARFLTVWFLGLCAVACTVSNGASEASAVDGGARHRDAGFPLDANSGGSDGAPGPGPDASPPPDASTHDASSCAFHTYFQDLDGDGYGGATTVQTCFVPPGFVGISGDCDDENPDVHPHQHAAFDAPFAWSDGSGTSFDYDCDGTEVPSPTAYASCNTASSGWANGEVCRTQADLGNECARANTTVGRSGATLNAKCGTTHYRCMTYLNVATWLPRGAVTCH